jgi:SAM-dependent methyltransferase
MSKTWNLTPTQWSDVLLSGFEPQRVAADLKNEEVLPWTETLLQYTRHSKSTLDLGSGRGQHSAMLALTGKRTTLLDWSVDNVQFSMRLFDSLKLDGSFCRADMMQPLPFKDNSFDTVFSCGVFEYFTDEEIKQILREAFRIATKQVIIMVPNAMSLAYRVGKFYMEKRGSWYWGGERPSSTLQPLFREAGCREMEEFTVATKHSLDFLTMRGGNFVKKAATRIFRLNNHAQPAKLKQGYLLVTIGTKA